MSEYIDKLVSELSAAGVAPSNVMSKQEARQAELDDFNTSIIKKIEDNTGVSFSDEQRAILKHTGSACILACAGSGKALANYEPVYTERGWVPIGKLTNSDRVYGIDGYLHSIVGIFHQGLKRKYSCHFSNGVTVDCNDEHIWQYWEYDNNLKTYIEKVNTLGGLLSKHKVSDNRVELGKDVFIESASPLKSHTNVIDDCNEVNDMVYKYLSDTDRRVTLTNIVSAFKKMFKNSSVTDISLTCRAKIISNLIKSYAETDKPDKLLNTYATRVFNEILGTLGVTRYSSNGSFAYLMDDLEITARLSAIMDNRPTGNEKVYMESVDITDEEVEMTCICVDAPEHLYITRGFIPTHNTTISVNLIIKRIMTGEINPDKLLFTTYSKAGTEEMKERIDKLLSKMNVHKRVQVRTLHSFFLSVLRDFGVSNDIIKDSKRLKFIREACKDAGYVLHDDSLTQIDTLLSHQVNNMLNDQETIESYVNSLDDLRLDQYKTIRSGYASRKAKERLIDYDDMQSYLYVWLVRYAKSTNQAEYQTCVKARNYCRALYDYFFIDEAQDISKIQYEIIKALVTPLDNPDKLDKTLILVGDDDQCIYQWRGSDPSIILSVGPKFDIQTFVLSTNYRCRSAIVDYATTGVKCNSSRYDKSMNAFKTGGDVKIAVAEKEDLLTLSKIALNHIKYWIANGENESDIAVLCRNNFHLALLSSMLFKEGIPCVMTDDMRLTKSFYFKDVETIMNIIDFGGDATEVGSILWKMCSYMKATSSRAVGNLMNNTGLDTRQALGYILKNICGVDVSTDARINIPTKAEMALQYSLGRMSQDTVADLIKIYVVISSDKTKEEKFRGLLLIYFESTSKYIYKSKDKQRSVIGISSYFVQIAKESGFEALKDFVRYSKQYESSSAVIMGDPITLVTEHSSKGREWKNVIMFACDNVSQPSIDGIKKLRNDGVSVEDIFANIDEERRLHYVGNTRAKNNLLVITYNNPSMFILEALGVIKDNCNQKIYDIAMGYSDEIVYADDVRRLIQDKSSPYYYDAEKYKV